MARKLPELPHVKYVRAKKGQVYAYFNTGKKRDGKPIYTRLPDPASVGFLDSYLAMKAGRTKRGAEQYTVASMVEQYRRSATFRDLAQSTQSSYGICLDKIAFVFGDFPVNKLESHHVRETLDNVPWGAGTCNLVVSVLGALYKWGRDAKKTVGYPTRDIDRRAIGQHEPWPQDVLEAALTSDDDLVRLAVHLLYFTGQRIGDVCKMRWGDIREGRVHVLQQKTGKTVEPLLAAELARELEATPRAHVTILPPVSAESIRARLQAFTKRHGVKTVPHGLRKNAVNALLEAGCTVPEVAAITGQTHAVVEHYAARVNRRHLSEAAVLKFNRARAAR